LQKLSRNRWTKRTKVAKTRRKEKKILRFIKKESSATGNRTPVSRVTGRDTSHYTIAELFAVVMVIVTKNWYIYFAKEICSIATLCTIPTVRTAKIPDKAEVIISRVIPDKGGRTITHD
jgi:hypothetical protein